MTAAIEAIPIPSSPDSQENLHVATGTDDAHICTESALPPVLPELAATVCISLHIDALCEGTEEHPVKRTKKPANAGNTSVCGSSAILSGEGWITGLEPATSRTTIWRSNQLSYIHHSFDVCLR